MSIELRPYQVECRDAVERMFGLGYQRLIAVLATGLGKTTIFTELARREIDRGGKVLVLAHREELLDQAAKRMSAQGGIEAHIEGGTRQAGRWVNAVVASVATVGRENSKRLDWFTPSLVICDEAHHAAADTYMNAARRFGCYDEEVGTKYLGVTATPHRMDNRPLHGQEESVFQGVAYTYGVADAINAGWLTDVRAFRAYANYSLKGVKTTAGDYNQKQLAERVNNAEDREKACIYWEQVAKNRKTIVFCVDVEHAHQQAALFRARGYAAEAIDGSMDAKHRAMAVNRFRTGETQILTNCNIATEGFDVPDASCVMLLRPTKSWSLFVQMTGRGLRLAEGKQDCIVIDVVGAGEEKSLAHDPEMPNVAGMLGLPPTCKANGGSLRETMREWGQLDDWAKARLANREFDMDSMRAILEEVDLLTELQPPQIVKEHSSFVWMPAGDDRYVLKCGDGRNGEDKGRVAVLTANVLGGWFVTLRSKERVYVEGEPCGDDEAKALEKADEVLRKTWPYAERLAGQSAGWRKGAPTDKQKKLLMKFGYELDEVNRMSKGEASAAIDRLAESGWKKIRREVS